MHATLQMPSQRKSVRPTTNRQPSTCATPPLPPSCPRSSMQQAHLFDGGMQQTHLLLARLCIAHFLLCNQAVHTRQKAVHPFDVVRAPHLHWLLAHLRTSGFHCPTHRSCSERLCWLSFASLQPILCTHHVVHVFLCASRGLLQPPCSLLPPRRHTALLRSCGAGRPSTEDKTSCLQPAACFTSASSHC